MKINSTNDIYSVFIAIATGVIIALLYTISKSIVYSIKKNNIVVLVFDIFYSCFSAIATFLLLFCRVKGEIRWFILISEALGFILIYLYISKYITKYIKSIMKFIKKYIVFPVKKTYFHFNESINSNLDKIINKIFKKFLKHN